MHKPYLLPVSIKGIVFENGKVWLRKNERNEWELPGGKMDENENPEKTVEREIYEELGFEVTVVDIVQVHLYKIKSSKDESHGVLVVTYLCELLKKSGKFEVNGEAGLSEFKKFSLKEMQDLKMPEFYKESIKKASEL